MKKTEMCESNKDISGMEYFSINISAFVNFDRNSEIFTDTEKVEHRTKIPIYFISRTKLLTHLSWPRRPHSHGRRAPAKFHLFSPC